MKKVLCILSAMLLYGFAFSQSTYSYVKKGNKQLEKEAYSEAEIWYRKALELDPALSIGSYNLGNAKYLQGDFEKAIAQYEESLEKFTSKVDKAATYHNIGNTYLSGKKYEKSIEAYKNALKLVPEDMDTKYNLAYAQLMLKKQQEQEEQENQEDKEEQQDEEQQEDKEEQQDKEDSEEKDEESDQNEAGDKDEDAQSEENQDAEENGGEESQQDQEDGEGQGDQEGQEPRLTKEQAEQLLQMLQNEEGKLQEKLDKPEGDAVNIKIEKDW